MTLGIDFWGPVWKVGAPGINRTVCGGDSHSCLLGVEFLGSVSCHTTSFQTGGRSWGWPRSPAKKAARPCLSREVWGAQQRRVEKTGAKERAAGLGASSAVLSKTLPKRSQDRTGQTRATWAQGSPMTAVFRGRFPSCSRKEGGRPGDGRGEGEREEEGSKQETTERASSRCSENTRLRSRWVAACVQMKQGVGGRVKNKHTLFLPVIHSPRLPDPAAHVPTGVGAVEGGRKTVRQAPTPPKYEQLSVNQNCFSPPVTCAHSGGELGIILGTWDLRTGGGGGGPSGQDVGVPTSQSLEGTSESVGGTRVGVGGTLGSRGGDERGRECPAVGSAGERRRY